MRVLAAAFLLVSAASNAWAADLSRRYSPGIEGDDLVIVRPIRRMVTTRATCVRCSHLPLGGLREPLVAHVPLGGLRKACPPIVVETIREPVVLRVKG